MKLYLYGHDYRYAVEQIMLVLFPQERPEYPNTPPEEGDFSCTSTLSRGAAWVTAVTQLSRNGETASASARVQNSALTDELVTHRLLQRILKQSFFKAAQRLTGIAPPWGALTGIRPAKLASKALEEGNTEAQVRKLFRDSYFVSEERTRLALDAAKAGLAAKESLQPDELSLYVGIPFCPTRCAYCSFVSADVKHAMKILPEYLTKLDREIETVGTLLPQAGFSPRTLYIGGGTPTTLSAQQLDHLMKSISSHIDLSRCTEYTVEAGRPDTITPEKLAVIRENGANRVSVNPQTMRDEVLEAMGREHTAEDIIRAYHLARDSGIEGINMDLIAGLPQDTVEGFRYSLDAVLDLNPENITVHTLALKKGARLFFEQKGLPDGEAVSQMLDYAWNALGKAGYFPYYLYRQKFMSGSFENIGWCKPGFEGLYNICIMEELHTILALGGGGSTKLTNPATGKVVRITNPKYPYEYIRDIDKICAEKEQLVPFQRSLLGLE
jgi:oxygen-independent coproporphyrinogen-3 oxidase